ncbi:hypothetical protein I79_005541 [Cricetulus griseus]|uniref:Uncharacterized protein n=1 Tax=Cricetulus griseus TaxID=10029 RepID=G3H5F9_CRIGR|nr:hypothetical protein I79_005541 [Cricetulus griseus]
MAVSISACQQGPLTLRHPFTVGLSACSKPNPQKVMKWTQGHSKVLRPLIFL